MVNEKGRKFYVVLMLVIIIIAFGLGYFSFMYLHKGENVLNRKELPASDTLALDAVPIKAEKISFTEQYIGYITPIHEAQIQPFISGFIEQIYVKGGDKVRKGDTLIVLEQSQYKAELTAAYANILKAKANYQNAMVYYERIKKAGQAVSPTELDTANANFLTATAELEQAKANYELALVNYNYTIIKAPIDGVVGNVFLTKGNYVSPSSGALISIVQYNPIRVVFSITDKEYLTEMSKKGFFDDEKIKIELPTGEIFAHNGSFQFTDNSLNRATNSIAVYADFENIGQTLVPNAYVTVLVEKAFSHSVRINKSLVTMLEDDSYVYIIRQNRLLKAPIRILASEDTDFIVADTFEQGDYLVTERVQEENLNQNVRINLVTPPATNTSRTFESNSIENPAQNSCTISDHGSLLKPVTSSVSGEK